MKLIAHRVLGCCAEADHIAQQASASVGTDEERFFALLEARDAVLTDLATHTNALQLHRYQVDDELLASTERGGNETDALFTEVCDALSASHLTTMALAERVTDRVEALRAELTTVQRAGSAGAGYGALDSSPHVDRVR